MALGDISVLNHYPINEKVYKSEDNENQVPPSIVYLPYPVPQPGMENQTEGFNIGRFAGAVAPIIAGLFGGGGLSTGDPDFTTPYDDYLNPNRQHTFGDFGPDGNPVGFSTEDIAELNKRYPNPYETLTE